MAQMQVFVSHSHKNNRFCAELVEALSRAGADVWYDDECLQTGQLGPIIERELRARPVFIVVLSPAALKSQWVEDETRWAYYLRRRDPTRIILPVLAEEVSDEGDIWLFLQDFRRIGQTGLKPFPRASAIERTLHALQLTLPGEAPLPTAAQPAESAEDLITRGNALQAQGKHAEALPLYDRVTQLDPRSFGAWANLSYALLELKRYEEALVTCERALTLDPNSVIEWVRKGVALRNLGRADEALAAYERALALDPNYAFTWNNKAAALLSLHRNEEALWALDRALALNPNNALAWSNKGVTLDGLIRSEEALSAYDSALALNPNYADAWHNKAISLRALGRTREAEEAERRAKELGG